MIFKYGKKEINFLSQADPKLGEVINKLGFVERKTEPDLFSGLCYNIVNQQLSMKACNTLWNKLTSAAGEMIPQNCLDPEKLKTCGLSKAKADCISACAEKILAGDIDRKRLSSLSDNEIITQLCSVKGIGKWTAEMTLIFCLSRPDVLSLSDYGIRKGLSLLHGIDIKDIKTMESYKELYSPYGTTASIYLWEAARILPERNEENAEKDT